MSTPQWNADIITPSISVDADVDIQTNGGLDKDASGALGVKVDNSTITINSAGALQANGGGSSYEFTDGLVESSGVVGIDMSAITSGSAGTFVTDDGQVGVNIDEQTIVLDQDTEKLKVANPLPEFTDDDDGKVLTVVSGSDEYAATWSPIPPELPAKSASDAGKALVVNSAGTGVEWASVGGSSVVVDSSSPLSGEGTQASPLGLSIDTNTLEVSSGGLDLTYHETFASNSDTALYLDSAGPVTITVSGLASSSSARNVWVAISWDHWGSAFITWTDPMVVAANSTTATFTLDVNDIDTAESMGSWSTAAGRNYFFNFTADDGHWTEEVYTEVTAGSSANTLSVKNPVPAASASDAGKALVVNSAGTGVEWASVGGGGGSSYTFTDGLVESSGVVSVDIGTAGLDMVYDEDLGKYVLGVKADESTITVEEAVVKVLNPLPVSSASDAGKVLSVDSSGSAGWEASKSLAAGSGISITESSGVVTIAANGGGGGGSLPTPTASDAYKIPIVNSAGTGFVYDYGAVPGVSLGSSGQVLVNSGSDYMWGNVPNPISMYEEFGTLSGGELQFSFNLPSSGTFIGALCTQKTSIAASSMPFTSTDVLLMSLHDASYSINTGAPIKPYTYESSPSSAGYYIQGIFIVSYSYRETPLYVTIKKPDGTDITSSLATDAYVILDLYKIA